MSGRATQRIPAVPTLAVMTVLLLASLLPLPGTTSIGRSVRLMPNALVVTTPLTYHGNYNENETGPSIFAPAGDLIEVAYGVQVIGYNESGSPGVVRLPSAEIVFETASGPLHVYSSPANATTNATGFVTVPVGPPFKLVTGVSFNRSSLAFLSTMGVAVMASWPNGAYAVNVRWHWTLVAPDGSATVGAWSNPVQLVPAALAQLAVPLGHSWVLGGSYSVCLAGPLAGRSFLLRLSVASPTRAIVEPAFSVASNSSSPACWRNTIPSEVSPQSAWVHLWETSNTSYLLYEAQVQLVSAPPAHGSHPSTLLVAGIAGGIGIGAVVALVVLRARFSRRPPPQQPPGHVSHPFPLPPPPPD